MSEECIICFKAIDYKNEENKVMFTQTCQCFYNVHQSCLLEWLKVKNVCLVCGKKIHFYQKKEYKPFISNINSGCCTII